jgi:hypothetical protein
MTALRQEQEPKTQTRIAGKTRSKRAGETPAVRKPGKKKVGAKT